MDYIRRMSEKSRLQKLKQAEEEKAKSGTKQFTTYISGANSQIGTQVKKQATYRPKSYELDDSSSDSRGPQLTSNFFNVPKRPRYPMTSATDKPNLPPQYKQNEYAIQ